MSSHLCILQSLIDLLCNAAGHGGGWGYSAHSVEAIRFCADADILLGGLGLFGGRGEYTAKIKVSISLTCFYAEWREVIEKIGFLSQITAAHITLNAVTRFCCCAAF